jgi:S-adenosylmethionine-diacylglycerol 3-amino-3-carboxypropyl transferase
MIADDWVVAAASLPLAFSQVREDTRIDVEIAGKLPPGATAMMIASGGETALCLSRLPLSRLVLVDVNPAQLALTRCRFHLAGNFSPEESMCLLGHLEMLPEKRFREWERIFESLGLPEDIFGGAMIIAKLGPDHCGRYEAAFAEIRQLLRPNAGELSAFLEMTDAAEASRAIESGTALGSAIDSAFNRIFALKNLTVLFGEGATRNPRRPFHEHFPAQLRAITARQAPAENPWIWQIFSGKFPPGAPYDWLRESKPPAIQPEYRQSTMLEALDSTPERSVDFLHLSNILDWLSPEEAGETLAAAHRVLKPGGVLVIRQLNSSLEIPSLFPSLLWHGEEGRRLQLSDRSFFYPEILLASRP